MKIKQKKRVNFWELTKWAWENEVTDDKFENVNDRGNPNKITITFDSDGDVRIKYRHYAKYDDAFEIFEEIEVTEDTNLKKFFCINGYDELVSGINQSVNDILKSRYHEGIGVKYIFLADEFGAVGEMVWSQGGMVE